ncbi:hypothetical protein ATO12_16545 [Aquimarina atlantica]|uniref:DUF4412 domain-containing protein n=1 Tax=Aquimarina atlantica TaxID=1317122 RepID=A0A023BU82_9FLAO|nr:hypothetical protein [Aquimarina atlantica]EZH73546.1 hypothetical protein ATO12_16545 [Aquimarina atlantica]
MNSKPIILLITILFFASFSTVKKSFEGVITYKVETKFKKNDVPHRDYLEQKFGDTLKVYYNKNGDIFKKYLNTGEKGYDFNLYLNSNNHYYAKWKNLDTIYHYNVSEQALEFVNKTSGKSEQILGKSCDYIQIEGFEPSGKQKVIQKYSYSGFPYLEPELFKNFKDFYTYDLIKEAKSPFMKMELDLGDFIVIYTAIQIEPKELHQNIFVIPNDIPKKEY